MVMVLPDRRTAANRMYSRILTLKIAKTGFDDLTEQTFMNVCRLSRRYSTTTITRYDATDDVESLLERLDLHSTYRGWQNASFLCDVSFGLETATTVLMFWIIGKADWTGWTNVLQFYRRRMMAVRLPDVVDQQRHGLHIICLRGEICWEEWGSKMFDFPPNILLFAALTNILFKRFHHGTVLQRKMNAHIWTPLHIRVFFSAGKWCNFWWY